MPGMIQTSSADIAAGVRDDFKSTYDPKYNGVLGSLSVAMHMDVPFNHRTETFAMYEDAPYPERFDEGNEAIPEEGMGSKSFSVTTYDYGKRIGWKVKDREDNKIGDLKTKALQLGARFASVPSKIFAELLTSVPNLLPAIPNAPDGAAPYSATDGDGGARFGLSGGNIETGGGIASSGAIQTDFYQGIGRFAQFQDTKGEPYWDPDVTDESYTIFFNAALQEVFSLAFFGTAVHSILSSTGATVSNTILARGIKVNLRPTSRLTDNDWFIFRDSAEIKPFFRGVRRALTMQDALMGQNNSDVTRDIAKEYVQFTCRDAYGVNMPFATVKVNN